MVGLSVNMFLYLFFFIFLIIKDKRLTAYNFLILCYAVIAMIGYYICDNGIYAYNTNYISVEPFIFSFIFLLILIAPLKRIDFKYQINYDKPIYNKFIIFICICSFVYSLLLLAFYQVSSSLSYLELYELKSTEESIRLPNRYLNALFFSLGKFIRSSMLFVFVFIFERLIRTKQKKDLFYIALISVPQVITYIIVANRGGLFFFIMTLFFFILIYYNDLDYRFKRIIFSATIITVILTASYSFLITKSRVEQKTWTNETESILHYFGESFPNLGARVWTIDDINHPYGSRKFPNIYELFSGTEQQKFFNSAETSYYWNIYTKAPVVNFKTGFGDLYVEFGLLLTFIIAILINRIIIYLNRKYSEFSIIVMCICYNLVVYSLFDFKGESFISEIIWFLVIATFFKSLNKRKNVSSYHR